MRDTEGKETPFAGRRGGCMVQKERKKTSNPNEGWGRRTGSNWVQRKKERKQISQGRDGRTARRHHTGILRREVWCC